MKYFEQIKESLIQKGVSVEITPESIIKDLGIDSLDLMDSIVDLESALDIQIPDDKLMEISTIKDLLEIIETLKK
ncbi:acyl carrier protein [Spiroplasma endosymbiont of Crioceris asparagi]|uniref:acyl carrier protein n=1 Tax=Spiroplasma endosymbiont of Crioceris asparagi TaxID=3066286 RepID=UPI0030CC20C1